MAILLLLFCALLLCFYALRQLRRNIADIRLKNQHEPNILKRAVNWPVGLIWSSYVLVFAAGLVINNLILK